jgi:ATP-binding cassette subfamily C (CFTR/MRP) protein 1
MLSGPSGSGKRLVITTPFHMLEISSGKILVNGLDISHVDREDLRSHINAIPKDEFHF